MAKRPNNRKIEREYRRKLRKIAGTIGDLIENHDLIDNPDEVQAVEAALRQYQYAIRSWARATGARMVDQAQRKNLLFWKQISRDISEGVRDRINSEAMVPTMQGLINEQIELITSLPDQAIERVHRLTNQAQIDGSRAAEIARELARSGEVTQSRADLIAVTEVSRTSSTLIQAQAEAVGSVEYVWRSAHDSDVRPGHKEMDGQVVRWDTPPAVNEGTKAKPKIMHHHAGRIWRCRCSPEPIIPM